jgi:signal transduction histidine kinase
LISEQQNTLEQLENYIRLRLNYLKLQEDFKSFVSSVSHDLTSPLGYLKFSTDILTSQLGDDANEDIKETARVIANSTFKLSEDAIQIINDAKLKLEKQKKSWLIKDMLISSFKDFEFKFTVNRIIGKIEAELKSDVVLNNYLISFILIMLSEQEVGVNSIQIVELDEMMIINLDILEKKSPNFELLESKLKALKQKEIFRDVCEYLSVEINLYEKDSLIRLSYNLLN